jgi:NAD(P)-dependent dehydrogenase (short-subunit alcohol dehydrogenase family)
LITADLGGQRVLVVGATSGIGRGVALSAAWAGAHIAAVGRREALLAETIDAAGGGLSIVGDVTRPADCDRIVDTAVSALGGLDAVVLAVGGEFPMLLAEVDDRIWAETFAINVTGPSLIATRALPALTPGGVVAFMSSSSVGTTYLGLTPYSASKAALDEAIRGFALEYPEHRFTRLGIGPTLGTDMARHFDMAAVGPFMTSWLTHGLMTERHMEAQDLGRAVTEVVALLLAHPDISIPAIDFMPPGGIETNADVVTGFVDVVNEVTHHASGASGESGA